MNEDNTLLEKYATIAQIITQEKGPFKLFALLKREDFPWEWDVVLSAHWLPGEKKMDALRFIFDKIRAVLNQDEFLNISKLVLLDINEPFVKAFQTFLEEQDNPKVFSNIDIQGIEMRTGLIIVSPVSSSPQKAIQPHSPELLTQASKWIRKAASQGDNEAQNTLGLMYLKGEGVKKDVRLAKKWFAKAAALGHPSAQQNLEALHHF
ncbi:MAG: hypothetical protein DRR16_01895 [Candidatus Parabeggiatoa sp. nov. 3]|nr:MAG: hypothetical protein DRR00_11880 [Gammaproteobacteria bacterium]RKZ67173.1 MAG: hypothetical protein DRQ99_07490 [Gammaproteobacteria bacterium]RKZ89724.1 MAG: hypothetical protein DRR16_01895 [Gammaproteobacteria bacterium]HEW97348.1 sel1 repeat family protein [Beggiatoa sp.]